MNGRSQRRTTAPSRPRHPAATAAAAAFVLAAALPGTPSAGTHRAGANDLPLPSAPGPVRAEPGTAVPPIPSLDGLPDAASAAGATVAPRPYSAAVELTAGPVGGSSAPAALRAVRFALGQVGKPYVWGAEGPDTYDCSGLVQAAYASAGVGLPRVARAQYRATSPVPVAAMIPGDLLFFGTDPANAESIHHVGIYLGNGLMVHAPTAGDVVRVAPVWWAEFFGAARVVGAVPGHGDAVPLTLPPPTPVFRTVAAPLPATRRPAAATGGSAAAVSPGRHPARGEDPGGEPGTVPGVAPPAGRPAGQRRPACPAAGPETGRPAAGPAGSVTGLVTGLVGTVLRTERSGTATAPSPACSAPDAAASRSGGRPGSGRLLRIRVG
jgi:cell wall-associated NlpC family hydrolase